ncbi:MAG: hypothetical protein KAI66_16240 [Lentisphaeria bacterium]|nr:hypothetical protein [Lentisphaeria bacterium]
MLRTMIFGLDDLRTDEAAVLAAIDSACNAPATRKAVRGLCQIEDRLYLTLLPEPRMAAKRHHVLIPVEDATETGMASLLEQRWSAGFDAIATIDLGGGQVRLLLECPKDADK